MLTGDNGILSRTREAKTQTAIAGKKEEVQMALLSELSKNKGDSSKVTISKVVDEIKKNYSKQNEKEAIVGEATGEEEDKFPGTITFNIPASGIPEAIIIEVDENLQINANVGESGGGTTVSVFTPTSEYTKVGGVYCNSPELGGFNPNCTYYVTYDDSGTQISENTLISQPAPNGWYDYSSKKWANIMTNNNGNKTYWVWIPRFKYTADSSTKTTSVKFVTIDDKFYQDEGSEIKKEVTLSSDYQLSDAFTFNGTELAGYWTAKYRVQEGTNDGTASASQTTDQIEVDLSGFNKSNTFYVTYDDSGIQTSENTPISQSAPNGWYDYSKKKWANVVTKNNGNITYWTYIPRYKYQIWKELKLTYVQYIKPSITNNKVENNFSIPDSFTFNGQELKGYWVSKYRVQEGTNDGTASASQDTTDQIEVDLSGFNKSSTYYVTYNDSGEQTSENIPISQPEPNGWYDYSKKKWANVMTNNNGLKTYWTYIPRYKYQIWKELKQTHIRFIKPGITQSNAGTEWNVPDSFTFGNQQLKGYWVSKYRIQDSPADTSVFNGTYYK